MISTAVIINSLIWCQHLLAQSPDARALSSEMYTRPRTQTHLVQMGFSYVCVLRALTRTTP